MRSFSAVIFLSLSLILPPITGAQAQSNLADALKRTLTVVNSGSPRRTVIAVADVQTAETIFEHRGDELVIPASVLKLFTVYSALKVLGPGHTFVTELFVKRAEKLKTGKEPARGADIYLRGNGDPTLVSERLPDVAADLLMRGIVNVRNIVIDDSVFVDPQPRSGARAYQAASSAISFNQNALRIEVAPREKGKRAVVAVTSGALVEVVNRTHTVPGSIQAIAVSDVQPAAGAHWGKVLVSGKIGVKAKPVIEYRSVPDPRLYAGSSLRNELIKAGIKVNGLAQTGVTPKEAERITEYKSKPLASIVVELNQYSSNFIAQQLVHALGDGTDGRLRFWAGLERIKETLRHIGIHPDELQLFDGSGLDRRSRVSAGQIVKVLGAAYRDFAVGPTLVASLSRFGASGTLKRRPLDHPLALQVWAKTGTLDGVSSLAGYLESKSGKRYAFAIVTNGAVEKGQCMRLENELVRTILSLG